MLRNYLKTLPSTKIVKTNFPSKNTGKGLYEYLIYLLKNDPVYIVSSTSCRLLTGANKTTARRFRFRQSATKWVETLRPKAGFFTLYELQKEEIYLSRPIPSVQCWALVLATYRKQQKTPTLNGGDRGGVRILLFSEVTLFKYNVSTILSLIVGKNYWGNLCKNLGKSYYRNLGKNLGKNYYLSLGKDLAKIY